MSKTARARRIKNAKKTRKVGRGCFRGLCRLKNAAHTPDMAQIYKNKGDNIEMNSYEKAVLDKFREMPNKSVKMKPLSYIIEENKSTKKSAEKSHEKSAEKIKEVEETLKKQEKKAESIIKSAEVKAEKVQSVLSGLEKEMKYIKDANNDAINGANSLLQEIEAAKKKENKKKIKKLKLSQPKEQKDKAYISPTVYSNDSDSLKARKLEAEYIGF